jgi:transcriptional regulator with XRE-family HTH domain
MTHPVDIFVGKKIKQRRAMIGASQSNVAEELGVTFQQVQKYERGVNRVSCSRLYDFAKVLRVPITFFFEGFQNEMGDVKYGFAENDSNANFEKEDLVDSKETKTLLREYYKITDTAKRKHVLEIIKAMAKN